MLPILAINEKTFQVQKIESLKNEFSSQKLELISWNLY